MPKRPASLGSATRNKKTYTPETGSNRVDKAAGASKPPHTPARQSLGKGGARHIPHYLDRHEDYVTVSGPFLRELSTFGWLQEGLGAAGMFFSLVHFGYL
jgi:hypothetical protein